MQPPLRQARQKVALLSFRISWFIHLNQYRQVDVHTHTGKPDSGVDVEFSD